MFTKTNLISTIIAGIWSFMGGYLLWGVLADDFMNKHPGSAIGMGKEVPEFGILAFGCFIQAFILSTIYGKWISSNNTSNNALQFGVLIGIFVGFGNGLINYATSNFLDITGSLVNGIIYIIFYTIMTFIISFIYKKVV